MTKYTLIGGLCIASVLSTSAFGAKKNMWEGVYAAITGSVLGFESEAQVNAVRVDSANDYTQSIGVSNDYGENGFGGELAIGYGARGGNGAWALDGEIFMNFIGGEIDKDFNTAEPSLPNGDDDEFVAEETISGEESWGVRVKPGYFIHRQVKLFVPLAIVQTTFEHEYITIDPATNVMRETDEEEEVTGFEFGFGIEAFLTPNTSLSVSATRTVYDEYDIDLHTTTTAGNPDIVENNYNNSVNRGNVTFIYRF